MRIILRAVSLSGFASLAKSPCTWQAVQVTPRDARNMPIAGRNPSGFKIFRFLAACGIRAPRTGGGYYIKLGRCCKGWLRGQDLNLRPLGYEPNELPDCSTPHLEFTAPLPFRQDSEGAKGDPKDAACEGHALLRGTNCGHQVPAPGGCESDSSLRSREMAFAVQENRALRKQLHLPKATQLPSS